jgi:hypothetical protein
VIRTSGLRKGTLYQCRHSYAALQLSRGENPQYVAHQMGHTTLEMIIRHYGRWMRKQERESDASPSNLPPNSRQVRQKFARKWQNRALQALAPRPADRRLGARSRWDRRDRRVRVSTMLLRSAEEARNSASVTKLIASST